MYAEHLINKKAVYITQTLPNGGSTNNTVGINIIKVALSSALPTKTAIGVHAC